MIYTGKGFGIINKAKVDIFLELFCFFDDPKDVGHLISGSSAFSKSSLNIWKFWVHVLLKPHLENLEHYVASVWDEFSVSLQGKSFNITVIQHNAPTSNAEEAEGEWFCEDLQDLLELTPKKDVLFIIGDWNTKVESQETPGVTGKFGLGIWNKSG